MDTSLEKEKEKTMILYKIVTKRHLFGKKGDILHLTPHAPGPDINYPGIRNANQTVSVFNLTQCRLTPWGETLKHFKKQIKKLKKIKVKV